MRAAWTPQWLRTVLAAMLGRRAAITATVTLILLLGLRVTLRDQLVAFSGIFYVTPYPAQIAAWLALATVLTIRRRYRWACAAPIGAAVCVPLWLGASWISNAPKSEASDQQPLLMCWNAARAKNQKAVEDAVVRTKPDVCGLIEAGTAIISEKRWEELLGPQYDALRLPGGMMVIVRGKVLPFDHEADYRTAGWRARFALVRVEVAPRTTGAVGATSQTLDLMLCDIHSWPFVDKSVAFNKLRQVIAESGADNLIVMGDFNTPLESIHFRQLERDGLANAFVSAGNGMTETWGFGLPICAIDHVWLKGNLRAASAMHGERKGSDHRPVLVRLAADR